MNHETRIAHAQELDCLRGLDTDAVLGDLAATAPHPAVAKTFGWIGVIAATSAVGTLWYRWVTQYALELPDAILVSGLLWMMIFVGIASLPTLVNKPRAWIRGPRAARRIREWAGSVREFEFWHVWEDPSPRLLAVNPHRNVLVLADQGTGFRAMAMPAALIVAVKVAKSQSIHTATSHSGQTGMAYTFGSGVTIGGLSGGTSHSVATVTEHFDLEITYEFNEMCPPDIVRYPFGTNRHGAEVLAHMIEKMRASDRTVAVAEENYTRPTLVA